MTLGAEPCRDHANILARRADSSMLGAGLRAVFGRGGFPTFFTFSPSSCRYLLVLDTLFTL